MRKRTTTIRYVKEAIQTFDNDPPDNDFQRGYLQALIDVRDKK